MSLKQTHLWSIDMWDPRHKFGNSNNRRKSISANCYSSQLITISSDFEEWHANTWDLPCSCHNTRHHWFFYEIQISTSDFEEWYTKTCGLPCSFHNTRHHGFFLYVSKKLCTTRYYCKNPNIQKKKRGVSNCHIQLYANVAIFVKKICHLL